MVYITGDIHGDVQYIRDAVEQYDITGNDTIVILGDVGMNYYGRHGDRQRKKKLNKLGVPILCIHGNHEMRPFTIPSYYEAKWQGGIVYVEEEFPYLHFANMELYSGDIYCWKFVFGGDAVQMLDGDLVLSLSCKSDVTYKPCVSEAD